MEILSAFFAANLLWILVIFVIVAVCFAESYENFGWGLFSVAIFIGATIFWKTVPWSEWRDFNYWYVAVYVAGMFIYGLARMHLHGRKIGAERIAWKTEVQEAVDSKTDGYQDLLRNYQTNSNNPRSSDYQRWVPSSKDSKKKYAFWTICWPSSLCLYLLKDIIIDFKNWFVRTFKDLFDRTVVSGEKSALKGVDLTIATSTDSAYEDRTSAKQTKDYSGPAPAGARKS